LNNYESQSKKKIYDEPYVGMPIENIRDINRGKPWFDSVFDSVDICPVAMSYVPWQYFCETYEPAVALVRGTIFTELDLPFLGGGKC